MIVKKYYQFIAAFLLFGFATTSNAQLHFEDFIYDGGGGGALLDQASSVAVSPDGEFVYVTSSAANALNVFSKMPSSPTGELTFVEVHKAGLNGVTGLTAAQSVSVSPDGKNVYVVGTYDDALVTFSRNEVDGTLTFVEMHKDGLSGVDGLDAPYMVVTSPDGSHVYVSATDDHSISIFSRDGTTGALTYVDKVTNGVNMVSGLQTVLGITISADGRNIYAAGHAEGRIAVFSRDLISGALTFVESLADSSAGVDGLLGVFSVFVSPDGNHVYTTAAYENAVGVFSRNTSDGSLTYLQKYEDGSTGGSFLAFPMHVTGSAEGDYIYAVGSNENALNVFQRNASTGALTLLETKLEGNAGVTDMNFPVAIAVSPTSDFVYAAGYGSGSALVFDKNVSGNLTFVESQLNGLGGIDGLSEPHSVVVSPDGKNLYVAANDDDALSIFTRNESTGELDYVGVVEDGVDGVDGLYRASGVMVSPDGKHVYTTGTNDDAVSVFSRDEMTGELTFVEMIKDNTSGVDGLNGARWVTVSPDGNFVYIAGYYDDAIAIFSRNNSTGELTFVEMLKDGVNGVDGLKRANSVTITADGMFAYATGYTDDAIAVFSRNTSTGELTYIEKYINGVAGVNGLNGAQSVIVSSDGTSVYASGYNDNSVVAFSRNTSSGLLTFVAMYRDGVDGVDGLSGSRAVALNPDGIHLYAVSGGENAMVLFKRDEATSALTYEFKHEDGIAGINGISGVRTVAVSPFGRHIYVGGTDDNSVAIFSCTYFEEMTEDICQGGSVTIGNNVYTESGTFMDTLASTYGCRAITTLNLTVSSTSESIAETICDSESYVLGNQTLTQSGTYGENIINNSGCEVAVTLNLTVLPAIESSMEASICQGEIFTVGTNQFFETGTYENILEAANGCDSVVTLELYVQPEAYNEMASICSGETYIFGGNSYDQSGTYQQTFTSTQGCDSVVTLQLGVVNSFSEFVNETICEGGSITVGNNTYSDAGTYVNTLTSSGGCDSVVTLNLAVEEDIALWINETICEGEAFDFGGVDYTETGVYTDEFLTVGGCDSTVTLNLTVLEGLPSELNEVICEGESFNFGNNIYTETGVYTSTFSSPNGCETLVTLNLNVQPPQEVDMEATICEGQQYPFGSQLLDAEGTYVGEFTTLGGCDSIVTLTLNVTPTEEVVLFETICDGEIYTIGNQEFTSTGTYENTLTAVSNGCDSLIVLNLTVIDINGGALITHDDGTGIGAVNITISNGTPPYSFEWSNGSEEEDQTGLMAGTYSLTVSDANGCSETFTYTIDDTTPIENRKFVSFDVEAHPNPVLKSGMLNLNFTNDQNQEFEVRILDAIGKLVNKETLTLSAGRHLHNMTSPDQAGLYFIQIINEKNEVKSIRLIVQ